MPRPPKKVKIDMTKLVFNINEVCLILGLSRNTVDKLIRGGQIRAVRAGERRWIVPSKSVTEYLDVGNNSIVCAD